MGAEFTRQQKEYIQREYQAWMLKTFGINLRPTQTVVGKEWERIVFALLCEMYGEGNVKDVTHLRLPYDFLVNGIKIQSKTDSGEHRKSGVHLHRDGYPTYQKGDFDYLALRHGKNVYVAPFSVLMKPDGTVGSWFSTTNGQRWLNRWDLIGERVDPNAVRPGMLFPGGA